MTEEGEERGPDGKEGKKRTHEVMKEDGHWIETPLLGQCANEIQSKEMLRRHSEKKNHIVCIVYVTMGVDMREG